MFCKQGRDTLTTGSCRVGPKPQQRERKIKIQPAITLVHLRPSHEVQQEPLCKFLPHCTVVQQGGSFRSRFSRSTTVSKNTKKKMQVGHPQVRCMDHLLCEVGVSGYPQGGEGNSDVGHGQRPSPDCVPLGNWLQVAQEGWTYV